MKHLIIFLLIVSLLCGLLSGCGEQAEPSGNSAPDSSRSDSAAASDDSAVPGRESSEEPAEPSEEPAELIDMDAFLEELVASHPDASPEALARAILESPYFVLCQLYNTSFWMPGITEMQHLHGIEDSACIVNFGSETVIYILKPENGTSPETLIEELLAEANPDIDFNSDNDPDTVFAKELDGKVFFGIYHSDMQPITEFAEKPDDYVGMFHNYLAKHRNADCTELAADLALRQKFIGDISAHKVNEGRLTGFGDFDNPVEIVGFSDGACMTLGVEPGGFLGYVFKVKDGESVDSFVSMLRKNANPAWQVCATLKNVVTEADGNYVLFMMHGDI